MSLLSTFVSDSPAPVDPIDTSIITDDQLKEASIVIVRTATWVEDEDFSGQDMFNELIIERCKSLDLLPPILVFFDDPESTIETAEFTKDDAAELVGYLTERFDL